MASPTPSLDSSPGANSLGSLIDQTEPRSLSPLGDSPVTVSGSSPAASITSCSNSSCGNGPNSKCVSCHETFANLKILSCFHAYCQHCLEKIRDHPDRVTCCVCQEECNITTQGTIIIPDTHKNGLDGLSSSSENSTHSSTPYCTGCKSRETGAVARCFDCKNFLCPNCMMAHQFMHCFEGHRVLSLGELQQNGGSKEDLKNGLSQIASNGGDRPVCCLRHKSETMKYFCRTCNIPICKECTLLEHPSGLHDYEYIADAGPKQLDLMTQTMQESKAKATDLRNTLKNLEHTSSRLQVQYHKAQNEINDTFQFYRSMIEERKQELLKELESVFSAKQLSLNVLGQKAQEVVEKIYSTCEFVDRIAKRATMTEALMLKKVLDSKFQGFMNYNPDLSLQQGVDLEFVSNYQAIQVGVRNTFGYVRSSSELPVGPSKQPPIARPINGTVPHVNGNSGSMNGAAMHTSMNGGSMNGASLNGSTLNGVMERPYSNGLMSSSSTSSSPFESNIISKRFSSANSLGPFSTTISDLNLNGMNPYEKWSNGGSDSIFQNGGSDHYSLSSSVPADPMLDLTSKLMSTAIFPPKSQIKRQKMIYHCKFGEFGVMEGQFTEPSGVAVNAQNDIIVADTNNHRIQIFDKEGRFKFQFGECGKRDGQLLYPNRVAVVRTSGDIIVTERSPTHQIQIYNQYGQFVRKFGANILQHPRGVTVDNKGRIVVVECKVMRVIIFDQSGNVLMKFGCSKHLEFPNGVVVNDKQEIFISDNRAHCVKVFNYEGMYLRQIGGEGITNYPIGVGINSAGEILIADNHNNFNLTIFTQDGQLVSALESKVKHAQCFDVALMDDGSVVLASKDYRLYIYRYVQVPPIGL
ncbi:brain tumor protein [Anabrus simplex]|uniref:brain tumor protein n=1 Tax=Anabrus simplex TaxID=316456 RepID=UPI0034DD2654